MSKYFTFKKDIPELHNTEDIAKIREYLEAVGEPNCSDRQLYILWDKFSETWDAVWLTVDIETLKPFANWLSEYDGDLL